VGRYEEAAETFEAVLKRIEKEKSSSTRGFFAQLAATYAMMGRLDEAKACVAKVLEIEPKTSVEEYRKSQLYKDPKYTEQFLEALRRAGLPEKPTARF
jgi:adenylate cyclase